MDLTELLRFYSDDFVVMDEKRVPDGEGGYVTRWEDGVPVRLAVSHDTTIAAQVAEGENTASTYTFLCPKNVPLAFPDVVKRLKDGETFQITSDANDLKTPIASRINMAAVKAKKWRLP